MTLFSRLKGIHLPDSKGTASKPIQTILPGIGDILVFPMQEHIGTPCEPVVSIGDRVLQGQLIGDSDSYVSSPIHSSVSGVVTAIGPALTPAGTTFESVFIGNDGEYEEVGNPAVKMDYLTLSGDELISRIRDAGVVGLGGAGFPSHVKLKTPDGTRIETVIVNAAECEPYLTADHRLLLEETGSILRGLEILLSLFPGARGIVAVEENKPDAIRKLTEALKSEKIKIVRLPTKYPQGSEKQLIRSLTGRETPSGGLPADIGCIVHNVDTVIAIQRAVSGNSPLIRKIVTVAGGAVKNSGNYSVRIGTTFNNLINSIGGFNSTPYKMISGGPMMGHSLYTTEVPVIKTTSAFLAFTEQESRLEDEQNCIRCGKCVDSCPINLLPLSLNRFALQRDKVKFVEYGGPECIECGCCSYICPSKRHLAQSIKVTKYVLAREKKAV